MDQADESKILNPTWLGALCEDLDKDVFIDKLVLKMRDDLALKLFNTYVIEKVLQKTTTISNIHMMIYLFCNMSLTLMFI